MHHKQGKEVVKGDVFFSGGHGQTQHSTKITARCSHRASTWNDAQRGCEPLLCVLPAQHGYKGLMTPNWEVWWIHQQAVLPSSETWAGWKVGQRGT